MDLGKKIKELRRTHSITQEQLAEALGVTPQAVSRWESGRTMPDIVLLPELSVFFGVTIDELFALTEDSQLARIDNMIRSRTSLSDSEFSCAEQFLTARRDDPAAVSMLARLYQCRAGQYGDLSRKFAQIALEMDPAENMHHILCGPLWDWDLTNHHGLIDFYDRFTANHPEVSIARVYLAELLIADLRLEEAETVICAMEKSMHRIRLKGKLEARRGNIERAKKLWDEMTDEYGDSDKAWSYKADAYAALGLYDEAIEFYHRALSLAGTPRLIDNDLCLAHIYEMRRDYSAAAAEYEQVIHILVNDHGCDPDGDVIRKYRNKALRCGKR